METLTLKPLSHINGEVLIPGSKSLSNRILLLSAMAQGTTTITNLLDSDDVRHMLTALAKLGVKYTLSEDRTICEMTGLARSFKVENNTELFMGNSGTTMRSLTAALCTGHGEFTLMGEPRMYERPIDDLVGTLKQTGADIEYLQETGFPPIKINAKGIQGGKVSIKGNISSQYLTGMLMAAPFCQQDLLIKVDGELVSKPYIAITLDVMKRFGVEVENRNDQAFFIKSGQSYSSPGSIMVEGDASSASYFLAAAAIAGGSVKVHGTGKASVQGDARFAEVLELMGAKVTWSDEWIEVSNSGELKGVDVDLNHIPDAAMTIATTALFARGKTAIRNIYNWRVKETDRLAAMSTELRKLGAIVEEGNDYIVIDPPKTIQSAAIDTYDDHRMAMCFSLAAFGDAAITINDPGCTSKTFPGYFDLFLSLTR
ncbi:MAG: 3-phosphoshikimate 1-carboxyvinyltransferase [Gammaproteobacteria bacterium]|jgi:3-phosphoshikimate 1-carboxyvinyltransferase|nr:3-phosphoshikimate 1-carboxyvinyltransferase [Gammaproteobacteria bacterium]MBT3722331.1 3-phosphoshikimate 1-carboxyvinyltransferase [Gammaproteobacteria bacterium]MBT4075165.1 3-phosphoshikimate 1-carboxyvinyltransferase [Gammaproteobacteria bacterium]MBT4194727.1 3-phosphoshikimate 1-carboxyvinyltransferase [Gammaproteobacteria bacterium]MBT4448372.1 3-phosphoshikimate 1-carboxyvinyltransferase [Gammaproteobacteria bacterium]